MGKEIIGIVGDGQLGMMDTEAAIPMGHKVNVIGPAGPNSPAAQVGARQLEGGLMDPDAIHRLAEASDVLTIEVEHVNDDALRHEKASGIEVHPAPETIGLIRDKLWQKRHYRRLHLPVGAFMAVGSEEEYLQAIGIYGEVMVKARTGGYDGRGNLVPDSDMSWDEVKAHFEPKDDSKAPELYVEKRIPFQRELSVVGVRTRFGQVGLFPVVETVHTNSICDLVIAPAQIDPRIRQAAEEIGRNVIGSFDGAGVFAVELFQTEYDEVLINETAPRVHNSGHWSIEGADTSQFEQHISAITARRTGDMGMVAPVAVMKNVLGTMESDTDRATIERVRQEIMKVAGDNIFPHAYGKSLKPDRKVGHITVLGDDPKEAVELATLAREQIAA